MARDTEYQFVDLDEATLEDSMVEAYETITGRTLTPASAERTFINWVVSIIMQERALVNYIGNQNLPSRAEGENLDAIADIFFGIERPSATPATCTVRFHISEAQENLVLIPTGTRVTDIDSTYIWHTTEEAFVQIGDTYADVPVECETVGEEGNDFKAGQICEIVDLYDYHSSVENITVSANGTDELTDDEFYELMKTSLDGYSTAGAKNSYIYHAKAANTDIEDVLVRSPNPGEVVLYVLMNDGHIATSEEKAAVLAAVNDDSVRPLSDHVSVEDPEEITYNIELTYYMQRNSGLSAADIEELVNTAVSDFQLWQAGAIGRDINPSQLINLLMSTGIKRCVVTSPVFTELSDGTDYVPQIAKVGTVTIINGGYENA